MKAPSYPALLLSTLLLAVQGFNPIGRPVLTRAIHKRPLLNEARQVTLFLRPEDEGEYFQSEQEKLPPMERMKDPQLLLGAFSVFIPFILLGVAYGAGWVGN